MDLLSDGQIRWHDPISHVARGLAGFRIEGLLRYFDTNTYYRQPAAVGPIGRERPFLVDAYRFAAAAATPLPVKGIVTGPVTLAPRGRPRPRRRDRPSADGRRRDRLGGRPGSGHGNRRPPGGRPDRRDRPLSRRHRRPEHEA